MSFLESISNRPTDLKEGIFEAKIYILHSVQNNIHYHILYFGTMSYSK